jgi:hypothetical protein
MTNCEACGARNISISSTNRHARSSTVITRNEEFWVEVIREASRDSDPPPTLHRVHKLRAIFRDSRSADAREKSDRTPGQENDA